MQRANARSKRDPAPTPHVNFAAERRRPALLVTVAMQQAAAGAKKETLASTCCCRWPNKWFRSSGGQLRRRPQQSRRRGKQKREEQQPRVAMVSSSLAARAPPPQLLKIKRRTTGTRSQWAHFRAARSSRSLQSFLAWVSTPCPILRVRVLPARISCRRGQMSRQKVIHEHARVGLQGWANLPLYNCCGLPVWQISLG